MPPKVRGSEVGFAVLAALALRHLSGCQTCLAFLHISRGLRALLNAPIGLRVVGFFLRRLNFIGVLFTTSECNAAFGFSRRERYNTTCSMLCGFRDRRSDFVIAIRIS